MVSGTFVFSSPPATSPATDTGECWLRRRDSRPHVLQNAGGPGSHTSSDDSSPHPVPVPSGRRVARMLANRQDAQPALANVDHGLLGGLAPRLLLRVSRGEVKNLLLPQREIGDASDSECFLLSQSLSFKTLLRYN